MNWNEYTFGIKVYCPPNEAPYFKEEIKVISSSLLDEEEIKNYKNALEELYRTLLNEPMDLYEVKTLNIKKVVE